MYFAHSVISQISCANVRIRRKSTVPALIHVENGNAGSRVVMVAEKIAIMPVMKMIPRSS